MEKIYLKEDIVLYQFPPTEQRFLGQNIFVIYDNEDCLLIDCGYPEHMKEVKKDLAGKNIKYVLATHFHPDHIYGIYEIGKQNLVGSHKASETLKIFEVEGDELMTPNHQVKGNDTIKFGKYNIMLTTNPGHSNCGMLIEVEDLLFVGDDMMTLNNGQPAIPYVAENITQHITALEYISSICDGKVICPSHGKILYDKNVVTQDIKTRIAYLLFARDDKRDLEIFEKENNVDFHGKKWHSLNIEKN
ncbi:MBL fold metallo-hydrolase [Candidatus Izimaplasma bacterium]|nr:MBL fold metallo-hydrolase [Candidatus Izimaplasma bacterium]